jgi:hypothetical protein
MKRTKSGGVDGRSHSGGARGARSQDSLESASFFFIIVAAMPFALAIAYLTYVIAAVIGGDYDGIFRGIWFWLSLVATCFMIYTRGQVAFYAWMFGLFPAFLLLGIMLIGKIFRAMFS